MNLVVVISKVLKKKKNCFFLGNWILNIVQYNQYSTPGDYNNMIYIVVAVNDLAKPAPLKHTGH